jgi:hypothetical protein
MYDSFLQDNFEFIVWVRRPSWSFTSPCRLWPWNAQFEILSWIYDTKNVSLDVCPCNIIFQVYLMGYRSMHFCIKNYIPSTCLAKVRTKFVICYTKVQKFCNTLGIPIKLCYKGWVKLFHDNDRMIRTLSVERPKRVNKHIQIKKKIMMNTRWKEFLTYFKPNL